MSAYRRNGSNHRPFPAATPVTDASKGSAEDTYWREHHAGQPFASGEAYDQWMPAYRHGWEAFIKYPGRQFEDVERTLRTAWDASHPSGGMDWSRARRASHEAWRHMANPEVK